MFEKLQKIISESLGIEKSIIKTDSHLVQEFGADSLDLFDIFYKTLMGLDIEIKNSIEEDSFLNKFLKNPTLKTLLDFAKDKNATDNHVETPSIQQSKTLGQPLFKVQETKPTTTPGVQAKMTLAQKINQTQQLVRG